MRTLSATLALAVAGTVTLNAQWVQQKSGTTTTLKDIAVLDSAAAIAVGRDGSILKTTDAGLTWNQVPLLPLFFHPWNAVSFSDKRNGCAVGDNGRVATTTDGGDNWRWHGVPDGRTCLSALFIGSGYIYVGTDSGWVFHSPDTGNTWAGEKISTLPIRSLFVWRGLYAIGLPLFALTPTSLFASEVYSSGMWTEEILSAFAGLGSEAFRGEFCNGGGAGFIVGVQGDFRAAPAIVRKSMSDTVWKTIPTGLPGDGTLFGVSAPSSSVIYVCGDQGMIFNSTNGGDGWSAAKVPVKRSLRAIRFYNETRGFAVGDSGTILFTSNGGVTGIDNRDERFPERPSLYQNYPNPFNPGTTIRYGLPARSRVTLSVFNALGQQVAVLQRGEMDAGYHEVQFDGSELSSGVYFYTLQAGSAILTRRLLLLK